MALRGALDVVGMDDSRFEIMEAFREGGKEDQTR
jgi:hypothetical protein